MSNNIDGDENVALKQIFLNLTLPESLLVFSGKKFRTYVGKNGSRATSRINFNKKQEESIMNLARKNNAAKFTVILIPEEEIDLEA